MTKPSAFKKMRSQRLSASVLLASVTLNLLAVFTPLAILMIFERVVPHQSVASLQMICIGLFTVAVLEFMLRRARAGVLIFTAGRNAARDQSTFLRRVLHANPVALAQDDPAVHLERHAAIDQIRDQEAGEGKTLAIDLPFSFVFIALIGLIGGWLIVVPLLILALVMVFAWITRRAQRGIFDQRRSTDRRRYAFLSEVFSRITDVKANTMERQMARRFEMLQGKTVKASLSLIQFSGASQAFGAAIGQISVAAMGILGAYLAMRGYIGLAELAACMLLNGRVVQPVTKLLTIWVQSEATASARVKLREIETLPTHHREGARDPMRGAVASTGARLSDPVTQAPVTTRFSFDLSPGQALLVDAENDQFAMRLFAAIQGHDALSQGRIYIDGHLPVDWIAHRGAGGILMLEKRPAIFTASLMDNLSGFGTSEQVERARDYAVQLGLDRRVRRLPEGYDTPLNSGGFFERDAVNRQLVALVRALSLQPKILIMHEPSAILDVAERDALQRTLSSLENPPTMLLASPDPRIRNLADKTLHLESAVAEDVQKWRDDLDRDQAPVLQLRGAA